MIDIDRLKDSLNIVDVINSLVPLKKTGKNHQACCPFHADNTPSFTVDEGKQFYHCFGCGAGGDVVKFIQDYFNLDFIEAAKFLGGESEDPAHLTHKIKNRTANVRLPLSGKAVDKNEMQSFIERKCEIINNCAFYGSNQIIYLTDIHKNNVSMAMIKGVGFEPKYYKKDFLFGSCVVMGEISENEITILCECYHEALKIYNQSNVTVICFFKPLNLYFIYEDFKRITTNVAVIAKTEETTIQADKLNLLDCKYYNKQEINHV